MLPDDSTPDSSTPDSSIPDNTTSSSTTEENSSGSGSGCFGTIGGISGVLISLVAAGACIAIKKRKED